MGNFSEAIQVLYYWLCALALPSFPWCFLDMKISSKT